MSANETAGAPLEDALGLASERIEFGLNDADALQLERAAATCGMSVDALCGAICAREVFNTSARDYRRGRRTDDSETHANAS
jgi:hypothetical protein